MRKTGEVFKRFVGDKAQAAGYLPVARTLLGRMKSYLTPGISGARDWVLANGVRIRTQVAGAMELVTIDVRELIECLPIEEILKGIVGIPATNEIFWGPRDLELPNNEHPDYPHVVIKPSLNDVGEIKLSKRFFNKGHTPDSLVADVYNKRTVDTCGRKSDWYAAELQYGNLDWRHPELGPLTWLGSYDRYSDMVFSDLAASSQLPDKTRMLPGAMFYNTTQFAFNIPTITWKVNPTAPAYQFPPPLLISDYISGIPNQGLYYKGKEVVSGAVTGACLKEVFTEDGSRKVKLLYIKPTAYGHPNVSDVVTESLTVADFNEDTGELTNASVVAAYDWIVNYQFFGISSGESRMQRNTSAWLFNESGTAAVSDRDQEPSSNQAFIGNRDLRQANLSVSWNFDVPTAEFSLNGPAATKTGVSYERLYRDYDRDELVGARTFESAEFVGASPNVSATVTVQASVRGVTYVDFENTASMDGEEGEQIFVSAVPGVWYMDIRHEIVHIDAESSVIVVIASNPTEIVDSSVSRYTAVIHDGVEFVQSSGLVRPHKHFRGKSVALEFGDPKRLFALSFIYQASLPDEFTYIGSVTENGSLISEISQEDLGLELGFSGTAFRYSMLGII